MSDKDTPEQKKNEDYQAPEGADCEKQLTLANGNLLEYQAKAGWTLLREKEKPVAEVFSVAYLAKGTDVAKRPLTFVFNGGPGAASAYLHVGALGPRRVRFSDTGKPLPPPTDMEDNPESWLSFTDLVFIDPVGTGFSRIIDPDKPEKKEGEKPEDENRFFGLNKDLESLAEFMARFLSTHDRWLSPVFIAGESYGGFRVAKLAKLLQQGKGIGLSGAILISPALELSLLDSSDYDVLSWVDRFPVMAMAAYQHARALRFAKAGDLQEVKEKAEAFAMKDLALLLTNGDGMGEVNRKRILKTFANMIGLDPLLAERSGGRVGLMRFARELLKDERKVIGIYDASVAADDPFPDRDTYEGADPTLYGIERVFAAGINHCLRNELGLKTDREYHLLSMEVNSAWKIDFKRHALESQLGATDDLRYAMGLNPHMKVRITHGLFDLITPYFSSERICRHLKLSAAAKQQLSLKHYHGGHMFYSWEASRQEFYQDMQQFFDSAR